MSLIHMYWILDIGYIWHSGACRSSGGSSGLSRGAKAGIAIGVIAAVALAAAAIVIGMKRASRGSRGWHKESLDEAFDGRTDTAIEMQRDRGGLRVI